MRSGTKSFGEESWVEWACFQRTDFSDFGIEDGRIVDCVGDFQDAHYGGAGQFYAKRPTVRIGRSRVLVMQRCGFDV
jgi:hypothetical protein